MPKQPKKAAPANLKKKRTAAKPEKQVAPQKGPTAARRTMWRVIQRVMQQKMEMQRERLAAQV